MNDSLTAVNSGDPIQGLPSNGTVEEIVHKILSEKQELASNVITTSKKMNIEEEVFNFYLH
jgi:hypothetical protein